MKPTLKDIKEVQAMIDPEYNRNASIIVTDGQKEIASIEANPNIKLSAKTMQYAKQIEELSKHPKWIDFIESQNRKHSNSGRGRSKKHKQD